MLSKNIEIFYRCYPELSISILIFISLVILVEQGSLGGALGPIMFGVLIVWMIFPPIYRMIKRRIIIKKNHYSYAEVSYVGKLLMSYHFYYTGIIITSHLGEKREYPFALMEEAMHSKKIEIKKGDKIKIYYNPKKPEYVVLNRKDFIK